MSGLGHLRVPLIWFSLETSGFCWVILGFRLPDFITIFHTRTTHMCLENQEVQETSHIG